MTQEQMDIINHHVNHPEKTRAEIADFFGVKPGEVSDAIRAGAVTVALIKLAFREKDQEFIKCIQNNVAQGV